MEIDLRRGLDHALGRLQQFEGEVHIHEGRRAHCLLLRQGRVVAVQVAGHFDPLLARLRNRGVLSERAYLASLEDLARSERRSGDVATRRGAPAQSVEQALRDQLDHTLAVLRRRVGASSTVTLSPRRVTAIEVAAWRVPRQATRQATRPATRQAGSKRSSGGGSKRALRRTPQHRTLRKLALELHPDRLMHLPPRERRRREERLAEINAVLQGL